MSDEKTIDGDAQRLDLMYLQYGVASLAREMCCPSQKGVEPIFLLKMLDLKPLPWCRVNSVRPLFFHRYHWSTQSRLLRAYTPPNRCEK